MGRTLWIDDRELDERLDIVKSRFESKDHDAKKKRLKSGDYVSPGSQAACEHKAFNDFLGSISDKRIWKQKDAMEKQFDHNCFIVTGSHVEDWVADIYGGHAHATRMMLGTCAYFNQEEGWSAFWIQSDDTHESATLLAEYLMAWFRQIDKHS